MLKNIVIFGATSSIARATAMEFAAQGHHLFLLSRDQTELDKIAADLTIRFGIQADTAELDLLNHEAVIKIWDQILSKMKSVDGVLFAAGYLGDPRHADDSKEQQRVVAANFTGAIPIFGQIADYFATQKKGFLIAIGSVAGERGRGANYAYGAAKAALAIYLQGLRQRLQEFNVHVMTIKLGFVDTAMVYDRTDLFLVASPQQIAKKIIKALAKNREVIFLPSFWRYLIFIVKMVPEKIYKRLKI